MRHVHKTIVAVENSKYYKCLYVEVRVRTCVSACAWCVRRADVGVCICGYTGA